MATISQTTRRLCAVLLLLALASCADPGNSQGSPGSLTTHMSGRLGTFGGVTSR